MSDFSTTVRVLIREVLHQVPNIGVVNDYERWTNDWADFLDLYKISIGGRDVIRGWDISYRGFPRLQPAESQMSFGGIDSIREHTFVVQGYLELDDSEESEKAASEMAATVANAIESDAALQSAGFALLPCTAGVTTRPFGGVLVHGVTVNVRIQEYHDNG